MSSPGKTWPPTCPSAGWAGSSIRSLNTPDTPRRAGRGTTTVRTNERHTMASEHQDAGRWTGDGLYYEYSKAANPIAEGLTTKVPMADFPHHLHESGPTRVIPFDLSHELKCPGPATSPALCSNFIRIRPGEHIRTTPNATSELYYVIRGNGRTGVHGEDIPGARATSSRSPPGARRSTSPTTTRPSTGSTTSPCSATWASPRTPRVQADALPERKGCHGVGEGRARPRRVEEEPGERPPG